MEEVLLHVAVRTFHDLAEEMREAAVMSTMERGGAGSTQSMPAVGPTGGGGSGGGSGGSTAHPLHTQSMGAVGGVGVARRRVQELTLGEGCELDTIDAVLVEEEEGSGGETTDSDSEEEEEEEEGDSEGEAEGERGARRTKRKRMSTKGGVARSAQSMGPNGVNGRRSALVDASSEDRKSRPVTL